MGKKHKVIKVGEKTEKDPWSSITSVTPRCLIELERVDIVNHVSFPSKSLMAKKHRVTKVRETTEQDM